MHQGGSLPALRHELCPPVLRASFDPVRFYSQPMQLVCGRGAASVCDDIRTFIANGWAPGERVVATGFWCGTFRGRPNVGPVVRSSDRANLVGRPG